jgi:hypothetical protein
MDESPVRRVASVMFDEVDDSKFPTLDDVIGGTYEGCLEELAHFLVVASDPHRVTYFDDEAGAIDAVNFGVLAESVGEGPDVRTGRWARQSTRVRDEEISETLAAGVALYHGTNETFLIVDPDDEERIDSFEQFRSSLLDYPLLDDSAYDELNSDEWTAFLFGGLRLDTLRDLRSEGLDEATVDAIDEAWDTLAPRASAKLDYFNGFTGEHRPAFHELVRSAFTEDRSAADHGDPDRSDDAGGGGSRTRLEACLPSLETASHPDRGCRVGPMIEGRGLI